MNNKKEGVIQDDSKKLSSLRIFRIMIEFIKGYKFINHIKKSATIWGGTRFLSDNPNYEEAHKLGELLSKEGYTVVSGGGPGIMEAVNRGAYEAGGESIGINIQLPERQKANTYTTKAIEFRYFFTRKVMMSYASSVYVFFPGGYGTLDEFFEMVVLLQTKKLSHSVTIIAIGIDFWQPLFDWLKTEVYEKQKAIDKEELQLFKLVDSPEEVIKYIKK